MLLKLSYALEESIEYFLLDTPYACAETIINPCTLCGGNNLLSADSPRRKV